MTSSSRERLEAALSRINDPKGEGSRAFRRVYAEEARAAAAAADARTRYGHRLGPLDGRILSIKDLFDVAGEPTTGGAKVYESAPPAKADGPVIQRLRAAGAVIVGKTNMTEFAFSGIGMNPHYGTPGNPADRRRVPGGSSSGAAVALADGMCEISIGSDTGGSVRVPAAFCGVTGFKPTQQRIPRAGAMALSLTLDSVGPLTTSVADAAAADAILAGEALAVLMQREPAGLRVAVPRGRLLSGLDQAVERAFDRAISLLAQAGARIVDIDMEPLLGDLDQIHAIGSISAVEAAYVHRDVLAKRANEIDQRVVGRIQSGCNVSGADYVRMIELRRVAVEKAAEQFAPYDAIVLPTTAIVAPVIEELGNDDELFARVNLQVLRNTTVFNLLDCCGLSLPIPDPGPLPAGFMMMGAPGSDANVLAAGAAVERLFH
ncbi:MAG: aspartyl-tRNA(Asn)/glutamyl-tRNA(Gln) amidotransferase subunit [Methylobacteriaceae bacterium]|nr:aspartyl-tRNA(Asn)/glutamyl-tRNA(Gln) amidotransferase subunit [Methylobacteriaceae bacterium]